MSSIPKKVIWLSSYPKSGNTWVFNVIRLAAKNAGYHKFKLNFYESIKKGQQPIALPFIRDEITGSQACTVMKSHARYTNPEIHPDLGLETVGAVYIKRNPLDMLLSYINFTRIQYARSPRKEAYAELLCHDLMGFDRLYSAEEWASVSLDEIPQENLDHALKVFSNGNLSIPLFGAEQRSWLEHVRTWHSANENIPCVILKYEDLLKGKDAFLPLAELFKFDESIIEQSINDVAEFTQKSKKKTFTQKVYFNKMQSHYFREYFSHQQIDRFLTKFEAELVETGYGDMLQPPVVNQQL